ncbi:hypothetical protein ONZ45_g19186 [Pleurotus djamor]|nr:hypothetical protein ONZ45_g19186 [Pleurotus djamor]
MGASLKELHLFTNTLNEGILLRMSQVFPSLHTLTYFIRSPSDPDLPLTTTWLKEVDPPYKWGLYNITIAEMLTGACKPLQQAYLAYETMKVAARMIPSIKSFCNQGHMGEPDGWEWQFDLWYTNQIDPRRYKTFPCSYPVSQPLQVETQSNMFKSFTTRVLTLAVLCGLVAYGSPTHSTTNLVRAVDNSQVSANTASQLVRIENIKNCANNPDKIEKIRKAVTEAKMLANNAWNYLNGMGPIPGAAHPNLKRYTTWFGAYTDERYKRVYDMFDALTHYYDFDNWSYHCDTERCGTISKLWTYAVCNSGDPLYFSEVHLCSMFWTANDLTRASTIIHEATHYNEKFRLPKSAQVVLAVEGTNSKAGKHNGRYGKEVYGPKACADLATKDPDYAVNNADNYNFFVEFPEGCPKGGCVLM